MTRAIDEAATNEARRRQALGIARIADLFGVQVKYRRNKAGRRVAVPPPPRVIQVLLERGARTDRHAPSHGERALKRRAKRLRYAANSRRANRQGWRSHGEFMKTNNSTEGDA